MVTNRAKHHIWYLVKAESYFFLLKHYQSTKCKLHHHFNIKLIWVGHPVEEVGVTNVFIPSRPSGSPACCFLIEKCQLSQKKTLGGRIKSKNIWWNIQAAFTCCLKKVLQKMEANKPEKLKPILVEQMRKFNYFLKLAMISKC